MGDIIGNGIAVAGDLASANRIRSTALTGYNYLNANPLNQQAQGAGSTALTNQGNLQGAEQALLTGGPNSPAAKTAFANYLNSTGYNFQRQQGTQAITGSAAARGMLNSGGTAKALAAYGQNLGANYFQNYLNQLGGLNTQLQNTANAGIGASNAVGQAGTQGGAAGALGEAEALGAATSSASQAGAGLFNAIGSIFGGL